MRPLTRSSHSCPFAYAFAFAFAFALPYNTPMIRLGTYAVLPLLLLACSSVADSSSGDTGPDTVDSTTELSVQDLHLETAMEVASEVLEVLPPYPNDHRLLLTHVQMEGTHNSYHKWPPPGTNIPDYLYEMPPLEQQLATHGVRQFEIDIHRDAQTDELLVYHAPVFDAETTCKDLPACLTRMKLWSDLNLGHHALVVMIEPKDDVALANLEGRYDLIEDNILQVWPRDRIIAPDDVRGTHPDLRTAVLEDGWPTLGQSRDKILFVLLDSGLHRDLYLAESPDLADRLIFPLAKDVDEYFAAFLAMDGPVGDFHRIQEAVELGFMVRTRSDSDPHLPVDMQRIQAAIDSGANCLSTNFPGPTEQQDWHLEIPQGTPSRCNPISAPAWCTSADIENL